MKISITGKANSGKNTLAKLLVKSLNLKKVKYFAFADPIKEIAQITFPNLPKEWLYGPSELRNKIIPNAFKNGQPLSVRELMIDIGNNYGRKYNSKIWINNFDLRYQDFIKNNPSYSVILTDCRFVEELQYLKEQIFFKIKLLRNDINQINDESETNQDLINIKDYDAVVYNNGSLNDLQKEADRVALLTYNSVL